MIWIPARYEGLDYTIDANGDPVTDPCSSLPSPTNLTFPYDRNAAANYAIRHSYDSNGNQQPLSASGYVTRRILNASDALVLPFADFYYSYLVPPQNPPQGYQQPTGSAVFISESIWAGGVPMTTGNQNSCTGDPSGARIDEGWRYCDSFSGASNPWDFHQVLAPYFTNAENIFGYSNNVIGTANEGQIVMFSPNNSNFLNALLTVGPLMGGGGTNFEANLRTGYVDVDEISQFSTLMQTSFQNAQLQRGDYVYINTSDAHGLMIVGWGEIKACAQVVYTEYQQQGVRYNVNQLGDTYSTAQPVPWVADFTRAQNQIPRPFYCTWFDDSYRPYQNVLIFPEHNWYFFRLKDSTSFTPSQILVDPSWSW
jgi:hypothetical protein